MVKTLIMMRHGKSAYPDNVADHARPLAPRGEREATLAGDWLRATQPPIDAVYCSTARRTRDTLAATGITAPTVFTDDIYDADAPALIELITLTDEAVSTLLMVGHVPGIPWTAYDLAANHDSEAAIELSRKFPTSALAVLTFGGEWAQLRQGVGELTHFHVPR
ncbi:SixA phosphatase family protein [Nocardia camponoti]|uniref:Phosphohistidine phosphatase n=1 Tax=Nocardia camponoti TaxID=1616106 RepID=A0A917V8Q5_9NOCA|nr:histidine phosphatase family protein [Nocardia camponoti]GGK50126.1 phosphohistidine phosphatase [Nocardia camponoti]